MPSGNAPHTTRGGLDESLPDPRIAPAVGTGDPPDSVPLDAGSAFDLRYESRELLGTGGMGEVRLCKDRRVGREVALKTARFDTGSEGEGVGRFLREARVQGQLEHPSVVPVYDLGRHAGGALYFTMKRVRGETLEAILHRLASGETDATGQYSRRKLLTAFNSVCLAVDFAHARGVLHRDLKPGNIMLGDFGEVYVLDWGVAKLLAVPETTPATERVEVTSSPPTLPATIVGQTMGTPGYMAPEQAEGAVDSIDARADVYALGAILFELLALEPLHQGRSPAQLLTSTLRGADACLSSRAPDRDVPPELEAICVKATAKEPRDRFPSARDLSVAVEGYLDGDRDLARRRELSAELTVAAAANAEAALAGGADALRHRGRAMHEISRALAFDPENPEARTTLLRLLTEPPSELPPAAVADMYRLARDQQRVTMRSNAVAFVACPLLLLPLFVWLGVKSWPALLVLFGVWFAASFTCLRLSRHPDPRGEVSYVQIASVACSIAGVAMLLGPYLLVPTVAVIAATGLSLSHGSRTRRVVSAAMILLGMVAPALAEMAGLLRPSTHFEAGAITLLPRLIDFPPVATPFLLIATDVVFFVAASILFTQLRTKLSNAERRLTLNAWHLQQLMPPEFRQAGFGASIRQ